MTKLPAIFDAISGEHDEYYMEGPFSVGSFIYATNNTVIVRASGDSVLLATYAKRENVPPVEKLKWGRDFYSDVAVYFTIPSKVTELCPCRCGGFCAANPNCETCLGIGTYSHVPDFCIGKDRYVWDYISLLSKHNVVEGYPAKTQPEHGKAPIYFCGDGFDGILMNRKSK